MGGNYPKFVAALCVPLGLALSPSPAAADDLPEAKSLTLSVQGEIDQRCALGAVPDLALGDLSSVRGEYRRHVALDCNVPVEVVVKAANGALANTAFPNGQGPYKGKLGYRLSMTMPVRKPTVEIVSSNFLSTQLVGGGAMSSDGGIVLDGFDLSIQFEELRGDDALLGGDYSEVIEITVTPI